MRNPPEQGVDIYYTSKRIAYQCKSVESGKAGDFNAKNTVASIEAAERVKATIGWKKYVLCTNVAISGTAEAILRKALPSIEILSSSYWVALCERYPVEIERNFRLLLELPRPKVLRAINNRFVEYYASQLKEKLNRNSFDVFIYSNRHDATYRVPVSDEFSCGDLIAIFREFFKLPEAQEIESEGIRVSLSHSIVVNGSKIALSKKLKDVGIIRESVITYWTTINWRDSEREFKGDVIHFITADMLSRALKSREQRRDRAIKKFSESIRQSFQAFDDSVSRHNS